MSKKIIAGLGVVAGLAVALAPTATFAEITRTTTSDEHTDGFAITVADTCAFGNDDSTSAVTGVEHNTGGSGSYDGMATWTNTDTTNKGRRPDNDNGTLAAADSATDTATYSIEAGTTKAGFATTTLRVYCNNSTTGKYTLKVTMDDLQKGETSNYIRANAGYSAAASGYAIDSVAAGTNAHGAVANTFNNKFGSTVETVMATSSTGTDTAGDDYTITYGIGVQANQEAGLYEGTVLYKLYQGV